MEHIVIEEELTYPVGNLITKNLSLINQMAQILKDKWPQDAKLTLWCRGSSGAIIAAIIATHFTDVVINHVKKPGEGSHSSGIYMLDNRINIIVDDVIASGHTVNAIYDRMFNKPVDMLLVTGNVVINKLNFSPKIIVCRRYY